MLFSYLLHTQEILEYTGTKFIHSLMALNSKNKYVMLILSSISAALLSGHLATPPPLPLSALLCGHLDTFHIRNGLAIRNSD